MVEVIEGLAKVDVPRMVITRKAEAFYNPHMQYQRDVTMSALRVFSGYRGEGLKVCDPLAGTGIRTLRMAREVPGIRDIVANDASPAAFAVMRKNLSGRHRGVRMKLVNRNANALFFDSPRAFDYIDVDPFGSPAPFLSGAASALGPDSMLGLTATDTGALCGSFPRTCLSRYGIRAIKTDFYKETGIRVLVTAAMVSLSRYDLAFVPVYSHANHYFRIMGLVRRKKSLLSAQFAKVGFVSYCRACLSRTPGVSGKCPECGKPAELLGPLWTGPLVDREFCGKMLSDMRSAGYARTGEIEMAEGELDHPFYYDLHALFRAFRKPPKKIGDMMEGLRSGGFSASRTHLCPTGIRTDAPHREIVRLL